MFTSLQHWNRRGAATDLACRYGRDYPVVLVDPRPVDELRR